MNFENQLERNENNTMTDIELDEETQKKILANLQSASSSQEPQTKEVAVSLSEPQQCNNSSKAESYHTYIKNSNKGKISAIFCILFSIIIPTPTTFILSSLSLYMCKNCRTFERNEDRKITLSIAWILLILKTLITITAVIIYFVISHKYDLSSHFQSLQDTVEQLKQINLI